MRLADGGRMPAQYLVGADGGRSAIRKAAGIEFPGWDATQSSLIAEVEVTEETPAGVRIDEAGIHGLHLMEDGRTTRVIVTEQELGPATEPTLADLAKALTAVYGTDFGVHIPTGSRGSPTPPGRPRPTAAAGCCSPATPRTSTLRRAGRGSGSASRTP